MKLRLGGFHALMSHSSPTGYIMAVSGFKEVLSTVNAPNSSDHTLTGHAYARAVRGHCVVQLALSNIVFSLIKFNKTTEGKLKNL